MAEGDVSIYYELKATDESLQATANRLVEMIQDTLNIKPKGSIYGKDNPMYSPGEPAVNEGKKQTSLLGNIVSGITISNFIWSAFSDFLKPIFKMLKMVLTLLFLPLIPILLPVLQALGSSLGVLAPVSADTADKSAGNQGFGNQLGTGLGMIGGGIIGGVLGSFLGPLGTILGATLGAGIGATVVNVLGTALGELALGLIDVGRGIGQAIWEAGSFVVSNLLGAGQWLLDNIPKMIQGVFDFGAYILATASQLIQGFFDFGGWVFDNISSFVGGAFFDFMQWLQDTFITPLATVIKAGIDAVLSTNWSQLLMYAFAKLYGFILDGVNAVINMVKSIRIPTFTFSAGNIMRGIMPSVSVEWVSPFSNLSNVAMPQALQSTISNVESGGGLNFNPTYNITGVGSAAELKNILEQVNRAQATLLRNKTSYMGGTLA